MIALINAKLLYKRDEQVESNLHAVYAESKSAVVFKDTEFCGETAFRKNMTQNDLEMNEQTAATKSLRR
jgi:hypothetical protein